MQHVFQMQTAEFLEILLNEYGVPAGKIRSLPEALKEDQFKYRELWNTIHLESINKDYKVPGIGFKVNQSSIKADKAPPKLGENTKKVLQTINFSEEKIEELIKENIIR